MKRFFLLLCLLLPFYLSAQTLTPQKHHEKELWGYWGENKNGKEGFVIKPKFEGASSFVDGHALVCRKSVWYVINSEGDEVAQMPYSNVDLEALNNRHFLVWQSGKCGVMDLATLNEIIPVKYTAICVWEKSFYKLHLGSLQGLADFTGKNILPVKYSDINRLSQGVYLLELGGKCGLADAEGREILNVQYDDINPLSNGGFLLELGGKYGFANAECKGILAPDYDDFKVWTQDRLLLRRGNEYSLVDVSGKEVCKGVYHVNANIYALISDDWSFANELGEPVDFLDRAIFYSTNDGNALSKTIGADWHQICDGKGVLLFSAPPTKIESSAFEGCTSLTSITIPNSVTMIGDYAFEDCSSLTSVTIGDSVTEIEWDAFYDCSSLKGVNVNITDLAKYCTNNVIYKIPGNKHLYIDNKEITELTIPDSVTSIGERAFDGCSSLTSVTIPDSVTEIGYGAFSGCNSLTSITIPDSVTSIGERAFDGCSSLTNLTIHDSVTTIGDCAFYNCSSLTSVTIPDSVTTIGGGAFKGCSSLTSITIPDSVTSIGWGAFEGCSSLTSVTIPDSVTEIGERAFSGCSSLTSVTIGNSVTEIGERAFSGCSSLTSITIPNSVTEIEEEVFQNCTNLSAFYGKFASSDNRCLIVDGVLIGFAGAGVESYVISSSVNRIGSGAFSGCSALVSIKIPDSVMQIGQNAFCDCTALPVVDGLIYAGNCLVGGTNEERQIHKIRPGTRLIAESALDCVPVKNLVVPASVTVINGEFYDYGGLVSVEFQGELCMTEFPACSDLKRVTHRGVSVEFHTGWK